MATSVQAQGLRRKQLGKRLLECRTQCFGSSEVHFCFFENGTVFYSRGKQLSKARVLHLNGFFRSLTPLLYVFCTLKSNYKVESVWTCRAFTTIQVAYEKFHHSVGVYNREAFPPGRLWGPGLRFDLLIARLRRYSRTDATVCEQSDVSSGDFFYDDGEYPHWMLGYRKILEDQQKRQLTPAAPRRPWRCPCRCRVRDDVRMCGTGPEEHEGRLA